MGALVKNSDTPSSIISTSSLEDCKVDIENLTKDEEDLSTVSFKKHDDINDAVNVDYRSNYGVKFLAEPCHKSILSDTVLYHKDGFSDTKLIKYKEGYLIKVYEFQIDNKSYFFKPFDISKAFEDAFKELVTP